MPNELKRGTPYITNLNYATADTVVDFVLTENSIGFELFARDTTAVIRYAFDDTPIGGVVADVDESRTAFNSPSDFTASRGRFRTIPAGTVGGKTGIQFERAITVHVHCDTVTVVECEILF